MQKVILVSGCPRSGTTLLNLLLNTHPSIIVSNECNLITIVENIKRGVFGRDLKLRHSGKSILSREQSPRENWEMTDLYGLVPEFEKQLVPMLRGFFSGLKSVSTDNFIFGDKFPKYYRYDISSLASLTCLDLYIIHISRNPVDVCSSFLRRQQNALQGKDYWKSKLSIREILAEWELAWSFKSNRLIRNAEVNFIDVNYDRLIEKPADFSDELSRFLDVTNAFDLGIISNASTPRLVSRHEIESVDSRFKNIVQKWDDLPLLLSPIIKSSSSKASASISKAALTRPENNNPKKDLVITEPNPHSPKIPKFSIQLQSSELLFKACKFAVNECIDGDYYEFGVYRGEFFYSVIKTYMHVLERRLESSLVFGVNQVADNARKKIMSEIRFHAFDSFEGLPELTSEDQYSDDFSKGQFSFSEKDFLSVGAQIGAPMDRVSTYPGWFSESCSLNNMNAEKFKPASLIMLDCDLYSSAKDAFNLITHLLQDGTILIIDDWFSNKGSPFHGVQKAFYDWSSSNILKERFCFTEYQKDSWKRISFIANAKK